MSNDSKRDVTEIKGVTDPFCLLCRGRYWAAFQQSSVWLQLTSHHLLGKRFLPCASTAWTVPAPWISYFILFYIYFSFYSILFYSILFYSILFYSILFYSILLFIYCPSPCPCGSRAFAAGLLPGRVPPGAQLGRHSSDPSPGEGLSTLPCSGRRAAELLSQPRQHADRRGTGTQTPCEYEHTAKRAGTFCPRGAFSPCVK